MKLLIAVAAWLLPGWLLGRCFGSPAPWLTAFLGSAVLWFHVVIGTDALGVRLSTGPLLVTWLAVCVILACLARKAPAQASRGRLSLLPHDTDWLWAAAGICGLASITVRAVLDPLSGWDNGFRWDYLARALLVHGNLHFYPPVAATDFEAYAWCDGIPPLVPLLNAWVYLITGTTNPVVTVVRIAGEALLLGSAVFGLAYEWWGKRGGWTAVGMLGTSALFLWSVAMGQETSLTALSLTSMLFLLERYHREPNTATVVWAGIAASVGALSREYGLAFPLLGIGILIAREGRRSIGPFAAMTIGMAAPWYLRNWAHTGNPLFPHSLGGYLPTNAAYADIVRCIGDYWRLNSPHLPFLHLIAAIGVLGGSVLLAGWVGLLLRGNRSAWPASAGIVLIAGLWLWSVPQTAGGGYYSLRVLTPALAIAAVLAGWLGNLSSGAGRMMVAGVTLLLSIDAARRAWLLPVAPLISPFSWTFTPWREMRTVIHQPQPWDRVVQLSAGGLIAVDNPAMHVAVSRVGGHAAMFFSPALSPSLEAGLPFDRALGRLRSNGLRLMVLTVTDPISDAFIGLHPFLQTLRTQYQPVMVFDGVEVFDLSVLKPLSS
ncbi:MAG: glycosyltransferase family 39 protein [Opitutaceae bacterium]|nr:glycosyltransferase family 39 protein [Opitutaceae bacterium]